MNNAHSSANYETQNNGNAWYNTSGAQEELNRDMAEPGRTKDLYVNDFWKIPLSTKVGGGVCWSNGCFNARITGVKILNDGSSSKRKK